MNNALKRGGTAAQLLVCNCEKTMQIDATALGAALGAGDELKVYTQLCRRQIQHFETTLDGGAPVLVACTQEAPLFGELAAERDFDQIGFVNIRERAGWCETKHDVTAKMAALIEDAGYQTTPAGLMTIKSAGQCLVYGSGQQALDVAEQLAERLSVTVILTDATDAIPPTTVSVPLHIGKVKSATGSLGAFALSVDGFAPALPSSMRELNFEMPRDGFSTTCELILDLSDGPALFSSPVGRDGYIKVDPGQPAAVAKAMFDISDLVGEFEKPLYVQYDAGICAHARSAKVGCSNCLDNCPTGAITPAGDTVSIDPAICGGCGNCSAVCPTGAVSYSYPDRKDVIQRVQTLSNTYRAAGGSNPVLVLHDERHGAKLIAMMARFGRGLPANAIPLSIYSVFHTGHDIFAAAFAAGFEHVVVVVPPDQPHDLPALECQIALMQAFLGELGYGAERLTLVNERDPDALEAALYDLPMVDAISASPIAATGGKRDIARIALSALNKAAPQPRDTIALPDNAPYGRLAVDVDNCTLCLACVGACPAGALSDDEERPRVSFNEAACVQCGLCVATCPERVIKLEPRFNFTASAIDPVTIKEEEPFECVSCGRPFGTKSTIERIVAKLEGNHAMFQNPAQINIIKMCDDCRVIAINDAGGDPMTMGERPRVRTTDDYLMEAANAAEDDEIK